MQTSRKPAPKITQTGTLPGAAYRNRWLVFGAAALVALLLYLPSMRYGFVWDDNALVVNNPLLIQAAPAELFARGFWNNPETERSRNDVAYYRPLSNLSLYVDHKLWGLDPAGFHLTNVLVNAAVVFLVSLLLWELFGSVWPAALGGLLVGIHPAMNCVVTFVANRTYLLALLFLLAGALALLRGRKRRTLTMPVLFGISLLLSTLALEAALVFAALAAAWILADRAHYQRRSAWIVATVLPVAVYCLLRFGVARVPFAESVMYQAITNPLLVINAFGQQLQLLLFPFNQKLIYVQAAPFTSFSVYTILGLLFLLLPLYALLRLGRSARRGVADGAGSSFKLSARPGAEAGHVGWFGYGWAVLFLLPFAHLVFLGPAGRMLYLAAPGVLIMLAALYRFCARRASANRVVYGALLVCTVAFAAQTLRRNPAWRDELSLSQTMVGEAPDSPVGRLHYGLALANAGRKEEAIEQLRAAVAISPDHAGPHLSLAFALVDRGDMPGAIRELREVVRLDPESPKARNDLAVALMRNGQLDSAIAVYSEALRLAPNSEVTLGNLGRAYLARGEYRQAIETLKAALRINPGYANARAGLVSAYQAAGMPDSAQQVQGNR